jgi:hypothetical protein
MGLVVVGVQCVAATSGKCYARELVSVAEELSVPLTWLIGVSAGDPMGNPSLYRNEFLHRIPSWHEIGVLLDMRTANGGSQKARMDLVRLGKEMLKQCHVKPTACWVDGGLTGDDLRVLEDVGILVLVAPEPTVEATLGLYTPSYDNPNGVGSARVHRLASPVLDVAQATPGSVGAACASSPITLLAVRDDRDETRELRAALQEASAAGSVFRVATATLVA